MATKMKQKPKENMATTNIKIEIKIEIVHREKIRPSSPTPLHLTTCKLSLLDQILPPVYSQVILFYPHLIDENKLTNSIAEKTQHLKETLSKTLTLFYPIAGRIKTPGMASIECNDQGVEFVEAKINCSMSEMLEKPDAQFLGQFLAAESESEEARTGPLLQVQSTFFQCGGMAMGLSISHNAMDGASFNTFLTSWVAIALGDDSDKVVAVPEFSAASLLPPLDHYFSNPSQRPAAGMDEVDLLSRRFVFEPKKIESLMSKASSESVQNPTRVEAVCALIWKSAMEASRIISNNKGSSNSNIIRPSVFLQSMNLRPRTVPPLPDNLIGNLFSYSVAKVEGKEESSSSSSGELQCLVAKLRKGMEQAKESYGNKGLNREEVLKPLQLQGYLINNNEIDTYNCSSWCRFSLYHADFGWGKPSWVSTSHLPFRNFIFLLDTKDGDGIEAWLFLRKQHMVLVESNEELLAFASLNPSVPMG